MVEDFRLVMRERLAGLLRRTRISSRLFDPFEEEAVFVLAQPASKCHALSLEGNDVSLDPNVPADLVAKPGYDYQLSILLLGVEQPAHTDGAVVVQPLGLRLAQQPVVCSRFFGGHLGLSEGWLEDAVPREFKQVTQTSLAVVVRIRHQASSVQDFRCFRWDAPF